MARPTYASRIPAGTDLSAAELGASWLGLPLFDQGRQVAGVMEARRRDGVRYPDVVVQMPRRSTKTTSVWAVLIGRALTREGYRCVTTAQSGNVASRILLEHAQLLIANGRCVESRERGRDDAAGKVVLYRNGGREHLDFPNGSRIWVVPPDAGAVRSAAADDIVVDEGGELDPVKGRDFMEGVRPLQDTRGPLAQFVLAGTPGKARRGPFWDLLEQGRAKAEPDLGIVDYSAKDSDDPEDRKVWRRVHPGPSSKLPDGRALTPMATLEKRFRAMGSTAFAREYLCVWPPDVTTSAINAEAWEAAQVAQQALPERVALAFDVAPDSSTAALCAAWRDEDGVGYVGVVDHRIGVSWLPAKAHAVARKHRAHVRFDGIGGNHGPAGELGRKRPVVTLVSGSAKDAQAAAQLLVSNLADGTVRHFGQGSLDTAAAGAAWRQSEGGRYFGRRASVADITPLVAASLALYEFDNSRPRAALRPRVVTA